MNDYCLTWTNINLPKGASFYVHFKYDESILYYFLKLNFDIQIIKSDWNSMLGTFLILINN